MKQIVNLFLLLLLTSLFYASCERRLSSEEGEDFLKTAGKRCPSPNDRDSLLAYRLSLFAAERKYDLTTEQHLRLKQMQLRECGSFNDELARYLSDEGEALATQTGNDSLLCAIRWDIFRVHQMRHDTIEALRVLKLQEPLVRRLYGEDRLSPYYYAIALIHNYHNNPEGYLHWLRKARPRPDRLLFSWYNLICEAYLKAGYNQEALDYADSALLKSAQKESGYSTAAEVKGKALVHLSRTDEALRWYAEAIHGLDSSRLKSDRNTYSQNQYQMIYLYASLLHKTKKTPEAIRELEKIIAYPLHSTLGRNNEDLRERPVSTARLMADCHLAMDSMERFRFYTRQADSLQAVLNKSRLDVQSGKSGEELQKLLLKEELDARSQEYKDARMAQYVLFGIVLLLLAIITAGILLWRKRQRRIAELFDLLVRRHKYWLELHHTSPSLPHYEIPEVGAENENYRRLFLHVLRIMEKEQPFLDPNMDLVALSRDAATNRSTLSAAINHETGMSFSNWLAEYRVNYLIGQLTSYDSKPIDALFPLAGFSSRTSFFRQFRQVTGMTPHQYMRSLKKTRNTAI